MQCSPDCSPLLWYRLNHHSHYKDCDELLCRHIWFQEKKKKTAVFGDPLPFATRTTMKLTFVVKTEMHQQLSKALCQDIQLRDSNPPQD